VRVQNAADVLDGDLRRVDGVQGVEGEGMNVLHFLTTPSVS